MRGMGACQDDIFSIARGSIVAIRPQRQSAMRLIFYITIWDEFIASHTMEEAIHTSSPRRMSVVVLSIFAARKSHVKKSTDPELCHLCDDKEPPPLTDNCHQTWRS
jgi:hypothetical protein